MSFLLCELASTFPDSIYLQNQLNVAKGKKRLADSKLARIKSCILAETSLCFQYDPNVAQQGVQQRIIFCISISAPRGMRDYRGKARVTGWCLSSTSPQPTTRPGLAMTQPFPDAATGPGPGQGRTLGGMGLGSGWCLDQKSPGLWCAMARAERQLWRGGWAPLKFLAALFKTGHPYPEPRETIAKWVWGRDVLRALSRIICTHR